MLGLATAFKAIGAIGRHVGQLLSSDSTPPHVLEDFWYSDVGAKTAAGPTVTPDSALTYSAVWACARLLSGTGGMLPLNLYKRQSDGGKVIDKGHKLQTVLHDAANPEMLAMMFRSRGIMQQILWGNCYAEIGLDALGRVSALWPIHASRCKAVRDTKGSLLYEVRNNDGRLTHLDAAEVFHVPSMMSDDGITGLGLIDYARERIGLAQAQEKQASTLFGQGARPGVIVTHPQKLSPTARTNFRKEWNDMHQGPDKAGNLALLQEGADIKVIGMSQEEAQAIEQAQLSIEEVARFFGVPPHMIQHLLRATFNNIEHMGIEFVTYALIPWLKLWEQAAWHKLLTEAEKVTHYIKHVVDALLRGDAKSRTEALQQQFFNGALTLNQWCEIEDRNPIGPLGDRHFLQSAMITIEQAAGEQPKPGEEAKAADPAPATTEEPTTATDSTEAAAAGDIQATALNGAQIASLLAVVTAVATKQMPPDSGKAALYASFPLTDRTLIDSIIDPLKNFEAEKPAAPFGGAPVTTPPDDEEDSEEEDDADPALSAQRSALRVVLVDVLRRMAHKEANALRRVKATELFAWMDDFYGKHEGTLAGAVGPAMLAIGGDAAEIATSWCQVSKEALLNTTGDVTADGYPQAIEELAAYWEAGRVERWADEIMGGNDNAEA